MQQDFINIIQKIKADNPTITQDELCTNSYDTIKSLLYERYLSEIGYIYCLHNEVYNYYGLNYFKLGECHDLKKRMASYTTPFLRKCQLICVSGKLSNKKLAEHILFQELDAYRCDKNREFFNCDLQIIKKAFIRIEEIFNEFSVNEIIDKYIFDPVKNNIRGYIDNIFKSKIIKENEAVIDKINYLIDNIETNLSKITIKKIDYYKMVADGLNIKNKIELDYERDKEHFNEKIGDDEILNKVDDIKRIFRIIGSKYCNFDQVNGYERLYKMAISMCKHLFGNNILICKKRTIRIKKKFETIRIYHLNKDYLKELEYKYDDYQKPFT